MADVITKDQLKSFQDSLFNLSDVSEFLRIAIFGKQGSGKTTAAATCPKPAMLWDCGEKGTRSIMNIPGIKGKKISGLEDLDLAIYYLKYVKHPFKSLIIDTGTTLQDLLLSSIMGKAGETDPGKSMRMPTKNDWGSMSKTYKDYIAQIKDLGEKMNIIWVLQEKLDDDADMSAGEFAVLPALSPSVSGALCASVDIIVQTLIINEVIAGPTGMESIPKYVARVGPDQRVLTKIRTPKGTLKPQVIEDLTFDKIKMISDGKWEEYVLAQEAEGKPSVEDPLGGLEI